MSTRKQRRKQKQATERYIKKTISKLREQVFFDKSDYMKRKHGTENKQVPGIEGTEGTE